MAVREGKPSLTSQNGDQPVEKVEAAPLGQYLSGGRGRCALLCIRVGARAVSKRATYLRDHVWTRGNKTEAATLRRLSRELWSTIEFVSAELLFVFLFIWKWKAYKRAPCWPAPSYLHLEPFAIVSKHSMRNSVPRNSCLFAF